MVAFIARLNGDKVPLPDLTRSSLHVLFTGPIPSQRNTELNKAFHFKTWYSVKNSDTFSLNTVSENWTTILQSWNYFRIIFIRQIRKLKGLRTSLCVQTWWLSLLMLPINFFFCLINRPHTHWLQASNHKTWDKKTYDNVLQDMFINIFHLTGPDCFPQT